MLVQVMSKNLLASLVTNSRLISKFLNDSTSFFTEKATDISRICIQKIKKREEEYVIWWNYG